MQSPQSTQHLSTGGSRAGLAPWFPGSQAPLPFLPCVCTPSVTSPFQGSPPCECLGGRKGKGKEIHTSNLSQVSRPETRCERRPQLQIQNIHRQTKNSKRFCFAVKILACLYLITFIEIIVPILVSSGCHKKYHRLGDLNNRNVHLIRRMTAGCPRIRL